MTKRREIARLRRRGHRSQSGRRDGRERPATVSGRPTARAHLFAERGRAARAAVAARRRAHGRGNRVDVAAAGRLTCRARWASHAQRPERRPVCVHGHVLVATRHGRQAGQSAVLAKTNTYACDQWSDVCAGAKLEGSGATGGLTRGERTSVRGAGAQMICPSVESQEDYGPRSTRAARSAAYAVQTSGSPPASAASATQTSDPPRQATAPGRHWRSATSSGPGSAGCGRGATTDIACAACRRRRRCPRRAQRRRRTAGEERRPTASRRPRAK